ncbi:MAG: AbrB/MazE/SpoVT family DNA-binding domain-containing protein [Methanosarcinales archaeon]
MISKLKIKNKGQITIPNKFLKKLNIHEGDEVYLKIKGKELVISPVTKDIIEEGFGLFGNESLDSMELKEYMNNIHILEAFKNGK